MSNFMASAITGFLLLASAAAASAQTVDDAGREAALSAVRDGNGYVRGMISHAAEQMTEQDYEYRPTPEVRSFGEMVAHVADSNFYFCATARGVTPPESGIEQRALGRDALLRLLAESFRYCDAAYDAVSLRETETYSLMGSARSPFEILTFRNYHALLHYGNIVTYMRLRGKVPPSSQ